MSVTIKAKHLGMFEKDVILKSVNAAEDFVLNQFAACVKRKSSILNNVQYATFMVNEDQLCKMREEMRKTAMIEYKLFPFPYTGVVDEYFAGDKKYNNRIREIEQSYIRGWSRHFAEALFR